MTPLHWSQLKNMGDSPAHYKHALRAGVKVTAAMNFSTLVHAALFGPSPYGEPVVFNGARRGKVWAEFKAEYVGQQIVTLDEVDRAAAVALAVETDPVAGPLVADGEMEKTLRWNVNGRECEGTPDNVLGSVLIDLKVSDATNPARFPWHAKKMGWFAQMAWYLNGLPDEVCKAVIIAVEPKPPHCVVVYELTSEALREGTKQWRSLFEYLMSCEASDAWPGFAQSAVPLDFPDAALELEMEGETISL